MSGIRLGDIPDMNAICDLAAELLDQSVYAGIKPDQEKFRLLVANLMGHKQGTVLVIVDDEDRPQGFLLGILEELFFSRKRMATDLAIYVREGYRHLAPSMVKQFIAWAESKPRLVLITLGISSGIGDPDRVGKFYEDIGLPAVGGIHMKRY